MSSIISTGTAARSRTITRTACGSREAYDRAGFYAYHLAEHHSTPLGLAPSPSVFLAAVAQRTRRLRFGPLVWAMPLHHPLRLIEEICMLDQLSGGRLEIGFGRGSVPIELEYYGADPADAQEIYAEAVELVLKGLTHKVLDFHGKRFSFSNVPMEIEPLQKPHPPIWYGVHMPESAERAARRNLNVVSLDPPAETRLAIDRYRAIWPQVHAPRDRLSQARPRPLHRGGADRCRGAWRWRAAPIWSGTQALPICSGGMDGRNRIRAPRPSIWWSSAARASPARRDGGANSSPPSSPRPVATTWSGNSPSAI